MRELNHAAYFIVEVAKKWANSRIDKQFNKKTNQQFNTLRAQGSSDIQWLR